MQTKESACAKAGKHTDHLENRRKESGWENGVRCVWRGLQARIMYGFVVWIVC
jgi:hypothetical protein